MRPRTLKLAAALALAMTSLAGCGVPPRLNTSSYEDLTTSLNKAAASLSTRDQARFDAARREFNAVYFSSGKDTALPPGLADWRVVDGMTPGEFVSFVARLKVEDEIEEESAFPNPALASRLLAQYEDELSLLAQNRERQIDAGRNTIDQYPIVDFAYVPPMSNVPMEYDHATFLVSLRNDSGFDAYQPTVRIAITDPAEESPILERTFTYPERREPIDPGETLTMTFECCSIALDPIHNRLLKGASPESTIEVELLAVAGHNNRALLNTRAFSLKDAQRMRVLQRCIERIKADVANWVPYAEADHLGGCGDPDQAENLLAMWEEQGVEPPREFQHLVVKRPQARTASPASRRAPTPPVVVEPTPEAEPHPDAAELAVPATAPAIEPEAEAALAASGSQEGVGSAQPR